MTLLQHMDAPSQAEQLYGRLKYDLMTGAVLPGRKLSIRSLAQDTGFGASPVREALKRLASERALESGAKRSYIVPDLDDERAVNLFNLRALLECEAAVIALPHFGAALLRDLRSAAAQMGAAIAAQRFGEYMIQNQRFHFVLYNACGNPDMVAMIEQLWMQTGPSLHRGLRVGPPDATWNHVHLAIIEAVQAGDDTALRHEMLRDIVWGAEHYTR